VFTLGICLLLSAFFSLEQCVQWVQAVAQSLLMQVLVTDPLITSAVLAFKLLASWALLRCDRRNREAQEKAFQEAKWDLREAALVRYEWW
jgi:hypothetical protein